MTGYTKLFSSILVSSIWTESNETRLLWITMLAMADKEGLVSASVPGLAKMAGIPLEATRTGLETLLSADPDSRTKDHDGRRIQAVEGGWVLLNHGKYRRLLSAEERKEYNRKKQAEYRMSNKSVQPCTNVNDNVLNVHSTEDREQKTEADPDTKALLPARAARIRKPKVLKEEPPVDFCAIWSDARQDSHYLKPWCIPERSENYKKIMAIGQELAKSHPRHVDQIFYATCEKFFESEDPFFVRTKHALNVFCERFNDFLQFRPQLETTHDGVVTKAGYTGSGKWVEPKALVQSQLLQEAREK